ncbi:MAG: DUF3471 domain-containing protein [Candidatus Aminicenantes bacterium]|nr:DUF3471 domain-containing protein [Candidatus Aminicenantes bacterium]
MKHGYSILTAEWNWDVRPGGGRLQLDLPIATKNGQPISQRIAAEIVLFDRDQKSKSEPVSWGNSRCYPVIDMKNRSKCRFTVRDEPMGKRTLIPLEQWQFARLEGKKIVPDPTFIYMETGFEPGRIYELVYPVKDPRIVGLGLAATRDSISFFRFETKDGSARPNPMAVDSGGKLTPTVEKVYIFGVSQSGRFITHMIYQGFHVDEAGRMVIDGAGIHVGGAGKGSFNHRFARPTHVGSHLEGKYMPADFFPFNFVPQVERLASSADKGPGDFKSEQIDPLTGEKGDVLAIAKKLGKIPYIMITNNEAEYWTRSASLLHTDVLGKKDAPLHKKVRIYLTSGAGHYAPFSRGRYIYEHSQGIIYHYPISRALLLALDRWASEGNEPPPSMYPRLDRGELLAPGEHKKKFPKIPGMRHPGRCAAPPRVNYGDKFRTEGIITVVPPQMGEPYITLVPNFDKDGNTGSGIRLPELAVPLGTYQGWNPRRAEFGAPQYLSRFIGSFWPFAKTEAERKKTGDPRPSLEARYAGKKDYVAKVKKAVRDLIKQGFLLKEDGDLYIKEAGEIAWPPEPIDNSPFWERAYHRSPAKVDTKIYKAYTGQYKAAVGGGIIIKISKKGKRLFLRIGGQPERELFPRSQTRYFTRDGLGELSFIKNAAGRVSKIVVHLRQGDIEASRI